MELQVENFFGGYLDMIRRRSSYSLDYTYPFLIYYVTIDTENTDKAQIIISM